MSEAVELRVNEHGMSEAIELRENEHGMSEAVELRENEHGMSEADELREKEHGMSEAVELSEKEHGMSATAELNEKKQASALLALDVCEVALWQQDFAKCKPLFQELSELPYQQRCLIIYGDECPVLDERACTELENDVQWLSRVSKLYNSPPARAIRKERFRQYRGNRELGKIFQVKEVCETLGCAEQFLFMRRPGQLQVASFEAAVKTFVDDTKEIQLENGQKSLRPCIFTGTAFTAHLSEYGIVARTSSLRSFVFAYACVAYHTGSGILDPQIKSWMHSRKRHFVVRSDRECLKFFHRGEALARLSEEAVTQYREQLKKSSNRASAQRASKQKRRAATKKRVSNSVTDSEHTDSDVEDSYVFPRSAQTSDDPIENKSSARPKRARRSVKPQASYMTQSSNIPAENKRTTSVPTEIHTTPVITSTYNEVQQPQIDTQNAASLLRSFSTSSQPIIGGSVSRGLSNVIPNVQCAPPHWPHQMPAGSLLGAMHQPHYSVGMMPWPYHMVQHPHLLHGPNAFAGMMLPGYPMSGTPVMWSQHHGTLPTSNTLGFSPPKDGTWNVPHPAIHLPPVSNATMASASVSQQTTQLSHQSRS